MKINDSVKKPASASDVKQKQTAGSARAGRSSGTAQAGSQADSAVSVSLSSQLQAVLEQSGETAVFDAKKVDDIKAAIASGQFQVDTAKVADGLISTVTQLIQKPRE